MDREARPQNAGSSCVEYCSTSLKKPDMVPPASASWKSARPSGEEKATAGGVGRSRL